MVSDRKQRAAFSVAGIRNMPMVRQHIWANVTAAVSMDVLASMTSRQIGAVIAAAHRSYHNGRASTGAEITDCGAIWIGGDINRLIDLDDIRGLPAQ
ncbi:MAG: hypothetical protein LBV49_04220 [Azonexus sp.]|jgi:hypothetical protein|nr:hypothetical protein [Azonexus sp.]